MEKIESRIKNDINSLEKELVEENNIPLALAALYFLISSNFLGELFTCSLRKTLSNNMLAKHILAIITLYISIMVTSKFDKISIKIIATIFVYIWFIITTKCTAVYVLLILAIIALNYLFNQYLDTDIKDDKNKKEVYDLKSKVNKGILLLCFVISLIGFLQYYLKQKNDYGSKFHLGKFIFGVPDCSNM